MKMKTASAILFLGWLVLLSERQFTHSFQIHALSPFIFMDAFNDRDLYSYMFSRKLAMPMNPIQLYHTGENLKNDELIVSGPQQPNGGISWQNSDVEARITGGSVRQQIRQEADPRFLLNFVASIGSTNSFSNLLFKTAYYFTTTTSTITTTTTCLSANVFVGGSSTVICRKRRELLGFLKDLNLQEDVNVEKGAISPSKTSGPEVITTAMPAVVKHDSLVADYHLASSKDEDELNAEVNESSPAKREADRRARFVFASTTIVTTYVFSTVTATRTLSTNLISTSKLSCRPIQFTYC